MRTVGWGWQPPRGAPGVEHRADVGTELDPDATVPSPHWVPWHMAETAVRVGELIVGPTPPACSVESANESFVTTKCRQTTSGDKERGGGVHVLSSMNSWFPSTLGLPPHTDLVRRRRCGGRRGIPRRPNLRVHAGTCPFRTRGPQAAAPPWWRRGRRMGQVWGACGDESVSVARPTLL